MPTRPYTARELEASRQALVLALEEMDERARKRARFGPDAARDDFWEDVFLALAAEPLARTMRSRIGPERLSIARLELEATAAGGGGHVVVRDVYARFGVRLTDLRRFVDALRMPAGMRLRGGHVMSAEEAVLITLRRFKHAGSAASLTWELGRSEAAISAAHAAVVEHIHRQFPHLVDSRSFSAFAPLFPRFAGAFAEAGVPLSNLVGFLDGKLWEVARPVRAQAPLYSGHKRCHGVKIQGIVFPNGIQPWPYGPIDGSRHDSYVLQASGLLPLMQRLCGAAGHTFILFGDSAYPMSPYLYRMYRGNMPAWQTAFNRIMSPHRVSVEWGFGKIANLWPWLNVAHSQQTLCRDVGAYLRVANVFTNMHTCMYGSIISSKFKVEPPPLQLYMAGGPF